MVDIKRPVHTHTTSLGQCTLEYMQHVLQITILFKRVHFSHNHTPSTGGTCITADLSMNYPQTENNITIIMDTISAENNNNILHYSTPTSIFWFRGITKVLFMGIGSFRNNFGSVIYAENSNLFLQGNLSFINNTGQKGGAITVVRNGYLRFMKNLSVLFKDNRAFIVGGAIYINIEGSKCAIQVTTNYSTINVSFVNNYAEMAGNSIFAAPIYTCRMNGKYEYHLLEKYLKSFNFQKGNKSFEMDISTFPHKFSVHYKYSNETLNCKIPQLFPGETLSLQIHAIDKHHRKSFSFVNVNVVSNSEDFEKQKETLWLKSSRGNPAASFLNLSIHTTTQGPTNPFLTFSLPYSISTTYQVKLLQCPLGFSLDPLLGSCECCKALKGLVGSQCFINKRIISTPNDPNTWIGSVDNDTAVSTRCPILYCNKDLQYKYFKSTGDEVVITRGMNTNDTKPMCALHRNGILCGQCNDGYSLTLGSNECVKCQKSSLILAAVIEMVSGLLLVFFIYALKLTLTTGTLNSIIFYVQAANAGLLDQILVTSYETSKAVTTIRKICYSTLNFLNTKWGFPMCTYPGMNQLLKTGLELVYPVYLLALVICVIIVSRYSTWLSNKTSRYSVQVLVTVVHISFSRLLLSLIYVFMPATIHTLNTTFSVWYWDGSVRYMGKQHIPLVVVTTVTVLSLLIPYLVILTFGRYMIKHCTTASLYLRPILEAVYAPYKDKRQYWFVARLLLVIFIYSVYTLVSDEITNIVVSFTIFLFLIGQALFRPFKSEIQNMVNCWLLLNMTIVYAMLWNKHLPIFGEVTIIAVMLALLTIILVLVYHVMVNTTGCYQKMLYRLKKTLLINRAGSSLEITDSFYGPSEGYREPLLSDKID